MSKHALYLIGEPGVGKSYLAVELTFGHAITMECKQPFAHRHYHNGVTELGGRRERFPGTDTLSMAVQPEAVAFLTDPTCSDLLLAEGDRLANDSYFEALERNGYQLNLFALVGPRVAARRREQRGSKQSAAFIKGRQTKVAALMERWSSRLTVADATLPTELLLRCLPGPVAAAFLARTP